MGEVYRARDSRLGREVAIKVLPAALSADPDRLRRFEQEARAAGVLNHPNILAVYDIGTHAGAPYLVTELLEGQTLRERLAGGALPHRKATDYGGQVARGLAAAHEKNIVHRDLKPENLFVTRDGRVKILDFGLAKLVLPEVPEPGESQTETQSTLTESGAILGTVGYMSPEQIRGERTDPRSDLFALGAVLYEMLSGRRTFQGASNVEALNAILTKDPPPFSEHGQDVPAVLDKVVRRCLEKNPGERFQSARDLAFQLETLSGLSGVSVAGATPSGKVTWRGKRTRIAWAAAGLLLVAVGLIAYKKGGDSARTPPPSFRRLTSRRGYVESARFAPDGHTIVYSAAWEGDSLRLFSTRTESPESSSLPLPSAVLLSISSSGEMALLLRPRDEYGGAWFGTLARAALAGGAAREVAEDVTCADWAPDGSSIAFARRVGRKFRVEFPAGKQIYETEGCVTHLRVSPGGDAVAFLAHPFCGVDDGWVVKVDLGGRVDTLSSKWESVGGLAWSAKRDEVWFSATKSGFERDLYAVGTSRRERLVTRIGGGITIHDVSRDGRVLLARENRRLIIMGLAPGETKERDLSWLDWSLADDLSNDGRTLLFTEFGQGAGPHYAVCMRKTDGSPVVRLGEGGAIALSPDGKWALSHLDLTSQVMLLPTGPGEPRPLPLGRIQTFNWAFWFPDGRRILITGREAGHAVRCWVEDLQGGDPRPITPEGIDTPGPGRPSPISPDSRFLVGVDDKHQYFLCPLDGGPIQPIPGLVPADLPIQWSTDGRSLLVQRLGEIPARVFRVDVTTGQRVFWKEFAPSDLAGVRNLFVTRTSRDGNSYVYNYPRQLYDLYLVDGLQ
jgi:serine/threonine protein kinase/dipeptidyl aminopeptidase/acylaminoacyl peptidase